jgi:anti-sigma factor RsiW
LRKITSIFARSLATPVREEEIHAYVDGALGPERQAAIDAYLALHPMEADRVDAYRSQKLLMHRAFDPVAEEDLSADLEELRCRFDDLARPHSLFRRAAKWTAMAACLVLCLSAGWLGTMVLMPSLDGRSVSDFTRISTEAHGSFMGVTPAAAERGPVLADWFSAKGLAPSQPGLDLRAQGFEVVGGRVFMVADMPVVQLALMGRQRQEVSLLLGLRAGGEDAASSFGFVQQGELSLFHWSDHQIEFSLVGNIGREELLSLAKVVQSQMRGGTAKPAVQPAGGRASLPLPETGPVRSVSDDVILPPHSVNKAISR